MSTFDRLADIVDRARQGDEPMTPHRVQLRRTKGWRMPPDTVKVDRSPPWGNPFVVGRDGDRAECVARFARVLAGDCTSEAERARRARAVAKRGELKGKNLACWCAHNAMVSGLRGRNYNSHVQWRFLCG